MKPIAEVAARIGIPEDALYPYGRHIAKLETAFLSGLAERPDGKLILVTAISPTPAGEGKTTTTVGLGDALNRIGRKSVICLREPSLGPCFGMKGGAAGGGYAQVVPMDAINLHFTGDFHAITTANNLLASMVDNHMYWGNALGIDQRRVAWRRALDLNDRALRETVVGLGGAGNGFPREEGFDITVASETMAAFCLASDLDDLETRLGRMIVGYRRDRQPVTATDLKAEGAMTALLKDALQPNLVQTLEGSPALVHGGPFANIAHGCNSVVATRAALKLGDYVVTEAGFGADLGAEKFFDIKCRMAGLKPAAAVIVASVRALKMHGGLARDALGAESLPALKAGFVNLARHIANLRKFGVPVVVAVNRFASDTAAELDFVEERGGGRVRRQGHRLRAFGPRRRRLRGSGVRRRCARRRRNVRLPAALSRRHEPVGKDAHDRARDLRRRRRRCRRNRRGRSFTSSRPPAGDICRSASPRPNIRSPTIRLCSARRADISRRCARCACAPARASSSS